MAESAPISLREHIEAIFEEHRRATQTAEQEREKAASILRDGLLYQIQAGDERLQQHIAEQVIQLRQMMQAQAALSRSIHEASEQAIKKAEVATEKRFESVNEFRNEARAVREQQQEQMARLVSELMPREVAEQRLDDQRRVIDERADLNASRIRTLETFQSKLVGGLMVVAFVGVANAVKIWTGG